MTGSILSQATPQETQVVKHDSFDKATFEKMKQSAEALAEVQVNGMKELTTFGPLLQDTFSSLYKYNPKVRPEGELKSSHRFNHSMVGKSMQTDQYTKLRQFTKLDDVNSALATVTIANKMTELIKTELKKEAEEANQLAKQEQTTQQMSDTANSHMDIAQRAGKGPTATDWMNKANKAQATANKPQAKHKRMQNKAQKNRQGSQQKIRQAMRSAEQAALDDIEETAELLEAWGTEPGQLTQITARAEIGTS